MNILSYKTSDFNGLSFELLVDDKPLAELVNYDETLIPFWIIDKGLPTIPPYQIPEKTSERIVAVCNCGEYGCDCLICEVEIEDNFVTFKNFKRAGFTSKTEKKFTFSKSNFQEIEKQLSLEAKKLKEN